MSRIFCKSGILKEVDSQNDIFAKVFEHMITFNLVSRSVGNFTDHVEFIRSFSHWEHLLNFAAVMQHISALVSYSALILCPLINMKTYSLLEHFLGELSFCMVLTLNTQWTFHYSFDKH